MGWSLILIEDDVGSASEVWAISVTVTLLFPSVTEYIIGLKKIAIPTCVYNNNVKIINYYLPSSSIMISITLDGIPKIKSYLGTSSTPNVSSDSSAVSSMNTNETSTNVW